MKKSIEYIAENNKISKRVIGSKVLSIRKKVPSRQVESDRL
ncbi:MULTISPECIES: hypothetical protein [Clostridium]|nr:MULTISPECIES: hypothetical protein [Clostridium]